MSKVKYSLVIPCYNEEKSLLILIPEIIRIAEDNNFEFILVNNGSIDGTSKLLKEIITKNIQVVTLNLNTGYGAGIKAGLKHAKGEYMGWIHADLQYSLTKATRSLAMLSPEVKYIKGLRHGRTTFQYFVSLGMSIFESLVFMRLLFDINAQPTVFHRSFYEKMIDSPDDFSIDLYSYVLAKKYKLKISRFKIDFSKRSHGKSTWNSGINSIIKMSIRTMKYSIALRNNYENY